VKVALKQSIEALDIVAVSGNLFYVGNLTAGSEYQVFLDAHKPSLEGCAISFLGKSA